MGQTMLAEPMNGGAMAYKIQRLVEEDAPNIKASDVMTITKARELLGGVSHSTINNLMARGQLTIVLDYGKRVAFLRPRRLVLREQVEELKNRLELGENLEGDE